MKRIVSASAILSIWAYFSAWVKQEIDLGTHVMFIAQLVEAEILSETPTVTYEFYQKNIKPKPQMTTK